MRRSVYFSSLAALLAGTSVAGPPGMSPVSPTRSSRVTQGTADVAAAVLAEGSATAAPVVPPRRIRATGATP